MKNKEHLIKLLGNLHNEINNNIDDDEEYISTCLSLLIIKFKLDGLNAKSAKGFLNEFINDFDGIDTLYKYISVKNNTIDGYFE